VPRGRLLAGLSLVCLSLAGAQVPAQPAVPVVYAVPIEGIIDLGLAPFVERVLAEATEAKAAAVVLEINTFGGRVDAAVLIRDALLRARVRTGGNVVRVVNALISADKANIHMPFKRAAAIDLAGRDVLEAVKMSVIPKVIETPRVAAVAKDGIQLIAVSRVTVRTNLDRLVGGAGEETVIARVGEGMVSTIGSSNTHKEVLENPDHISKHILSRGLDAGTAFEILSIDIADVDVGENIGAKLQIDQANADKQIAQAKAEERRAMAVAAEQEMRARVVEAEAEVPRAMAEAFRSGNLGIMDYYRMRNVQADTAMRQSIAQPGDETTRPPAAR
jgi:uncharacterized protein YqfA (UPF0365 family)